MDNTILLLYIPFICIFIMCYMLTMVHFSSLDRPFLVARSSISLVARSSISCRSIVHFSCRSIIHFSRRSIVHFSRRSIFQFSWLNRPSSLDRPLIIERNKISYTRSVSATVSWLATKRRRLNVTYPTATRVATSNFQAKLLLKLLLTDTHRQKRVVATLLYSPASIPSLQTTTNLPTNDCE